MRTAHLETVSASVSVATTGCHLWGTGGTLPEFFFVAWRGRVTLPCNLYHDASEAREQTERPVKISPSRKGICGW